MDVLSRLWQAEAKFGYLLEALDMGAPPHGIAECFLFDAIFAGKQSLLLIKDTEFVYEYYIS